MEKSHVLTMVLFQKMPYWYVLFPAPHHGGEAHLIHILCLYENKILFYSVFLFLKRATKAKCFHLSHLDGLNQEIY